MKIFVVSQAIQRWGFIKDIFEIYDLRPTRFVLEKLSIIDGIVKKKQGKEEEESSV